MNTSKLLIGFLLLMLVSACYKDKGNYDYKNVNDFEVTLTPAPANEELSIYLINQPAMKADTFRLVAEGKQTLNGSEDNLEYTWYRTLSIDKKEVSKDTITGKENLMELVAAKKFEWRILLVVRDKSMNLEYYKSLTVQTKVPFYNSWLFLHGEEGDRKLGSLSWNTTGEAEVTPDMMEAMGQPGYPEMTRINYAIAGAESYLETERLFLISASDSINYIFPFNCKVMGNSRQMGIPGTVKIKELISPKQTWNASLGMITEDGKLYFSNKSGVPEFKMTSGNVASNYKIDMAYMDSQGYITVWDNTNKRLMYFIEEALGYMGTLSSNELQGKKGLWLGRDAQTVGTDQEPCLFIAKSESNDKCYLYRISYTAKDDKMTKGDDGKDEYAYGSVTCDSTQAWGFTEQTKFAVTDYFQDQFFFTEDNTLYRGIMASGEKIQLYTAPGTIKKIAFRFTNETSVNEFRGYLRILGLLVTNADGTDEIHELHLSNAGDVEEKHVYDLGNVSVVDWAFSEVNRFPDR
jgi:hypothetical protein